ncbi:MAG: nuclear transport factor 2 family protein [Hyphomicrobiaceae bacterium]|nr:nuclear transport factor 2 family protein [Hyphomicrobiaceae bacterium]
MIAEASPNELAAIETVVWTYLDGLHEGDTIKLAQAFHEVSHLYSAGADGVADLPRAKWFELVASRPSAKAQGLPRSDRIVSIDQSGPETAFVKVECAIPPRYFTDYLLLLKTGGNWRIVSKSFRTVMRD